MTTTTIVAAQGPDAAPESRTITGLVLPFGRPGHTSTGSVTVTAGSVTVPDDIGRVKLLRDHSTEPGFTPVGYATGLEETPDGLRMSFRVAATPDGDAALADVTEHVRDALSVELVDTSVDTTGRLTAGTLTAVALVPIPAFADARVELVTAAMHRERTPMSDTTSTEPAEPVETDPDAPADPTDTPTPEPVETDPDAPADDDTDDDTTEEEDDMTTDKPARVPAGLTARDRSKPLTFSQAVNAISAMRTGRGSAELTAALADITRSANPAISGPAWLGELWSGADYTREIVPTMTTKSLTGMRGIGWRWTKRPEIDDYAGDKAEIPTNTVGTEAVEVKAHRLAAGWDIDRAYWDFGETEFLSSFFRAAAADYAYKTDARAAQFIVDSATAGTKVTAEPDLLHAAARARLTIKKQTRVEPTAFLVNPDSMFGLFQITQLDNPAYLDLLGVNPERFVTSDLVPAGQLIAYAKPAVTWFELPGSPIRVDAERIDHGGRDTGVFGYWATLLNDARGIVSVPFNETKPTAPAAAEAA